MSTSCQPGSLVIRVFSDVEKCFFLFSDLAVKPPDQKIKLFNVREGSDQQPCKLVLLTRSPGDSHFDIPNLEYTVKFSSVSILDFLNKIKLLKTRKGTMPKPYV